jgi:phage baseplate assembly protein gpV
MQSGAISIKNSGAQSYVRFYCESSNAHYVQLQAPAHSDFSGNVTITMPAVTDTLVGLAATQTLTNKTLTTPVIAEIDNSSDITLDAGADIILDADGANIIFKDGGTSILDIANNSSDVELTVSVADKNFAIKGTDGSSAITALDIDMALAGKATFNGAVVVGGDLTVNGTTTTVNSTTVTIDDPIFTLGGDTAPGSDDNKDRGIEFRYHNGSAAKIGFFGFDDSTSKFTFIADASNSSEVFSGSAGNVAFGDIAAAGDVTVGDDLTLESDAAVLNFGADSDVSLTHVADTALLLNSSRQLQFGDSGTYIHQSADGVLDLVSDTEIEINATTIDINGNVEISGDLTVSGDDITMGTNTSGHIMVADGTNFNPVAVSGDVSIAANGAVTIANTAVETAMIAADAITEAKIADDAVESEHINDNVISGQSALTSGLATTDELLISDGGTIKRMDVSVLSEQFASADDVTALAIALG